MELKMRFPAQETKTFAKLGMGCRKCTALEPNHSTVMPMALQKNIRAKYTMASEKHC